MEKITHLQSKINNRINNMTKSDYALVIIFVIGIMIRIIGIGTYPLGLNQDEASAGYDAYSILKYGMDRNGNTYPVYLVAWGSGQNALYSYICIPFIAILGLTEFSIRIPMAIIGCVSVFIIYYLCKEIFDRKYSIIITGFFAISPWHVMKSRWALESNIFPDIILLCVFFVTLYLKNKKSRYMFIASFLLGISAYSYGTAYLFIPVFSIIVVILLIRKRAIDLLTIVISLFIAFFTALPMLLFVAVNTFDLQQMTYFGMTIPKLYVSRHMEISSVFSDEFLSVTKENFKETMNILIQQNDGLIWNGFDYYGVTYIVSFPFTLIGIYVSLFKNKMIINKCYGEKLINAWLLAAFVVAIMVDPNINRLNILMLPLAIMTGVGIAYICVELKSVRAVIIAMYAMLFMSFTINYFTEFNDRIKSSFFYSLSDAIKYTNQLEVDKVYVTSSVNMPYIFTLFYNKVDVRDYISSKRASNPQGAFEYIAEYDKYEFYLPQDNYVSENSAIIVNNSEIDYYDLNYYQVKKFDQYSVLFVD